MTAEPQEAVMKLVLGLVAALSIVAPMSASAEVVISLRARIEPQCAVISVTSVQGSSAITVRTACNVEHFLLSIVEPGESLVESATGQNASASAADDRTIAVTVENPGFQSVEIKLAQPLGEELPAFEIQAA